MAPDSIVTTGAAFVWVGTVAAGALMGEAATPLTNGSLGLGEIGSLVNSFGVIGALLWIISRADKREQQIEERYSKLVDEVKSIVRDTSQTIKATEIAIVKLVDSVEDIGNAVSFCKVVSGHKQHAQHNQE